MATSLTTAKPGAQEIERVLITGDLGKLTPEQRLSYYNAVCSSLGLNPLTKPFAYLSLNGKTVLYALKDCTEQLRNIHAISLTIPDRVVIEGVYVVTAHAARPDGRCDEATGAVAIDGLKGESRANAMMKAETKAKRRVTLSMCGLGMLDETEVETIPGVEHIDTGGHPVGTQAAADHVAETQIADLKKQSGPFKMSFDALGAFGTVKGEMKKLLDDDNQKYYAILAAHGYETSKNIRTREEADRIYREMKAVVKEELAKVTQ